MSSFIEYYYISEEIDLKNIGQEHAVQVSTSFQLDKKQLEGSLVSITKKLYHPSIPEEGPFDITIHYTKNVKSRTPEEYEKYLLSMRGEIQIIISKSENHKLGLIFKHEDTGQNTLQRIKVINFDPSWPKSQIFTSVMLHSFFKKEIVPNNKIFKQLNSAIISKVEELKSDPKAQKIYDISSKVASPKKALSLMRELDPNFDFLSTKEQEKALVDKYPWYIKFIKNPSIELQRLVVKKDINNLKYILNPSKELLEELNSNRSSNPQLILSGLYDMREFTLPVQKFLIEKDPLCASEWSFVSRSLETKDPEIQVLIVDKNLDLIFQLKNPDQKTQIYVHKKNPDFFKINFHQLVGLKYPNQQILEDVIKNNPKYIEFIQHPSRELQETALKYGGPRMILLIKNPDPDLLEKYQNVKTLNKAGIF